MVIYLIIKLFTQINYLKPPNFCVYLFSRPIKNLISQVLIFAKGKFLKFREHLFLRMTSFGKFLVRKFQPQRKRKKKKASSMVES